MKFEKSFLRTVKIICCLTVLLGNIFSSFRAFAIGREAFNGNFVIRQETVRLGSVLVCRPSEIDTRIAELIKSNNIHTLDGYAVWLRKNITYKADEFGDKWSTPENTLDRLYGDCEDYAFLNAAVLRVLGYSSKVMLLGTGERDHAICVFEKDGYYFWFDNSEFKRTGVSTMKRFGKHMFKKYACSRISELSPDAKKCSVLYIST